MKFGVLIFPGSNCDHDLLYVLKKIVKQEVVPLWHKDKDLQGCDFIFLPGGFSYLGTAAFVAFIARTTHPAYTATQFALFTSLAAVPRTFINASAGWLVEGLGWFHFFLLCTVLAVPGMLLLSRVAPWNDAGSKGVARV